MRAFVSLKEKLEGPLVRSRTISSAFRPRLLVHYFFSFSLGTGRWIHVDVSTLAELAIARNLYIHL